MNPPQPFESLGVVHIGFVFPSPFFAPTCSYHGLLDKQDCLSH